jgi:hypothetical protein
MEKADSTKWSVSLLSNAGENWSEYSFGYKDVVPTGGVDGSLHVMVSNMGADGAHIMFYQSVTLKRGKDYILDFSVKAMLPMNNSWLEIYLGKEPVAGSDYTKDNGKPLGGFKWTGWEAGCKETGDEFDGTLQEIGCLPGSQDYLNFPGEGDTTAFLGFKMGIWGTAAVIEFVLDNFSLTEVGASGIANVKADKLNAYVSNNILKVSNISAGKVAIFNVTGQIVKSIVAKNSEVSCSISDLPSGIYFVQQGNRSVKIIK